VANLGLLHSAGVGGALFSLEFPDRRAYDAGRGLTAYAADGRGFVQAGPSLYN
jgi:hypothetical protein